MTINADKVCSVADCGRAVKARNLCNRHYIQFRAEGNVQPRAERTVRYHAMHLRVRTKRGRPDAQSCVDCGTTAKEWSYQGKCADELLSEKGVDGYPYCPHIEHYEPRCVPCHRVHDALLTGSHRGVKNAVARLDEEKVRWLRKERDENGTSFTEMGHVLGVNPETVRYAYIRHTWKHVV